jgi:hypothetical protein
MVAQLTLRIFCHRLNPVFQTLCLREAPPSVAIALHLHLTVHPPRKGPININRMITAQLQHPKRCLVVTKWLSQCHLPLLHPILSRTTPPRRLPRRPIMAMPTATVDIPWPPRQIHSMVIVLRKAKVPHLGLVLFATASTTTWKCDPN